MVDRRYVCFVVFNFEIVIKRIMRLLELDISESQIQFEQNGKWIFLDES